MITVDSKDLLADLQKFYLEAVRKMENMVRGFSYEISLTAIENTPLGDSVKYKALYLRRQAELGLAPIEGVAQGGWEAGVNSSVSFTPRYGWDSDTEALSQIDNNLSKYKLGNYVLIGNNGPYIGILEGRESIMEPTLASIMAVQQAQLLRYYNKG